jgi:RNA polymerase sigma factor (sigma-70 family)
MAWIPQTVDEALKGMEKRTQYLAYQFSVDYPPMRDDLEQTGQLATQNAFRYFKPGGRASFETYCGKAIRNAVINERKVQMKDFGHGLVEPPDEDFIENNATEENVVVGGKRYELNKKVGEVMEVVPRLTPRQQRVIVGETTEGLSTEEIAKELKLSTRQTRRIWNDAVAKLWEILAPKSARET